MKNKNIFIVMSAFLLPTLAIAENAGVEETNYSIAGRYLKVKNANNTYKIQGRSLSGLATFGLGHYGGATAYLNYNENNYSSIYNNSRRIDTTYGGLFFLRDASIGRVGIGYEKANRKYKAGNISSSLNSVKTTMYSVFLDYYIKDFTVAIERNSKTYEYGIPYEDNIFNISSLSGVWHIHDNVLLRVSKFAMDYEKLAGISLIYQPAVFNQSTSLTFKYLKMDDDERDSVSAISINYYFDTRVSLKNRERKYSSYLYSNFINNL